MPRYSYKNLRPYLITCIVLLVVGGVALMAYLDFATPVSKPEVTGIVAATPPQSLATNPNDTSYSVPALHPKYLKAQKVGLNARVQSVGLTEEGVIDAPRTAWEGGWYNDSALPGSGQGVVFIDGHVNDALNTPGIFYRLADLAKGDTISIIRGDDTEVTYSVAGVEQQPLSEVDMKQLLTSTDPAREGLTLVTCGGSYDREKKTFTERVIVYGVRQ